MTGSSTFGERVRDVAAAIARELGAERASRPDGGGEIREATQ